MDSNNIHQSFDILIATFRHFFAFSRGRWIFVDNDELDIKYEILQGHVEWDAGMEDSLGWARILIVINRRVAATVHHHRHGAFSAPHCRGCDVAAFFGRIVPFWQVIATLLRVVQCVTTWQSKCQKSAVSSLQCIAIVPMSLQAQTVTREKICIFGMSRWVGKPSQHEETGGYGNGKNPRYVELI
jgi:hypothetical protein